MLFAIKLQQRHDSSKLTGLSRHLIFDIRTLWRLRWLGHVFCIDRQRIPQQALYWQVPGYKRGPGRPRANWRSAVSKDLRKMGFTWKEVEVAALDRHGWRRSVAQCVQVDAGWTKVQGTKDTLTLSPERQSARMSKITNDGLTRPGTGCFNIWQQWTSNG